MAKHERQLIAGVTQQPIRYLISSTFHGNYSLGNIGVPGCGKDRPREYRTDLIDMMKMDNMPAVSSGHAPASNLPGPYDDLSRRQGIQILYVGRAHTRGVPCFVPADVSSI